MLLKKKKVQAMIILIIAMIIVLAGTFAWYSFNQRKTNEFNIKTPPDVNLHDDFDEGPEKDVYVENSGQRDVFVRVRLSEFMQIGLDSLVPGAIKDDPNTWAAHYPTGNPGMVYNCNDDPNVEWFHTYYEWTMGGRKFYRPAEPSARAVGDQNDPEGNYKEPEVVGDTTDYAALLRTAFAGNQTMLNLVNKFVDYEQLFSEDDYNMLREGIEDLADTDLDLVIWTNPEDPTETMMLSQVRLTKTGANKVGTSGGDQDGSHNSGPKTGLEPPMVISMADWLAGTSYGAPYAKGDFWVVDVDGWAYWANPLKPGEATGLLLSYVNRTENFPADDAYYAIDVWLQAVTADDIGRFGANADLDGGGGISDEGLLIMSLASGDFVCDDEGKFYVSYGNNVYAELNTDSIESILAKETTSDKFIGNPQGEPVSNDNNAIIEKGGTIVVRDYSEASNPDNKTETLDELNIVTGRNGKAYIELGDGSYAITVAYNEETGEPAQPYKVLGLGEGYDETEAPFVRVWPGPDGVIGSGDDKYVNEYFELAEGAMLHYLGDGVYVKTSKNITSGKYEDDFSAYYLISDKDRTQIEAIANYDGLEVDGDVVTLKKGELFRFQPVGAEATDDDAGFGTPGNPEEDDYTFEFEGMVQGANGKWYIVTADEFTKSPYAGIENPQGENTLITLNPKKTDEGKLGNDNNVLVWAKNPGRDDQFERFSEPFLKGVKKEDLLPNGSGFVVDGANWRVLDVDEYGNRLLLCDSPMGTKVMMGKSLYSQSNVKAEMQRIMGTLTTINKYALPVNTPVWYRQLTSAGGITATINRTQVVGGVAINNAAEEYSSPKPAGTDANGDPIWTTVGAEGFALSISEAVKYSSLGRIPETSTPGEYWWLRSAGKITGCGTKLNTKAGYITVASGQYIQKTEPLANQICGTHDGLSFAKGNAKNSGVEQIYTMGAYTDSYLCRVAMWVRFSDADKLAADIANGKVPEMN